MSNTSSSAEINSDAIDAVTEGINRVGILDSEVQKCANCGKEGSEVTNTCNKCNSVMYCNASCKKKHRSKHKKDCEEHLRRAAERVAELHDEKLFQQPPPLEDCPICMIRLPSLESGQVYMPCCGKVICRGCVYAFQSRATKKEHDICPFCRTLPAITYEENIKRLEKRMDLNDAIAIYNLGSYYAEGLNGLPQNIAKAFELFHRAGELGFADAYYSIGATYLRGNGVERDTKKANHYWELAAMGGDAEARYNLGLFEVESGNKDRALKHWMIAVRDGGSKSLENIKRMYGYGDATKDDYTKALQSYQEYLDEIKSDQRDQAAAFDRQYEYY